MAQSKIKIAKATYNFSIDGGATGIVTPKAGATVPAGAIVLRAWTDVTTPMTSGGAATVALDIAAGTPIVIKAATAYGDAAYTGLDIHLAATVINKTTSAGAITFTIAGDTLTAGIVNIFVEYVV
jgi:hypothetical protein